MAVKRKDNSFIQHWQDAIRKVQELNKRTNGWLGMLADAARQTFKAGSATTAAAIAYNALFALFPLTLLCIAIASFKIGPLIDQQFIVQKLEFIAPNLGQLLGQNIDEIILARGPVTIFALIGLIWSASAFFYMLIQTMNDIWGSKRSIAVWKHRGLSIVFVLTLVGPSLFLASFAGTLMTNLLTYLPSQIIPVVSILSIAAAFLLDIAMFMVVYITLPHGSSTWREILPGAIAAGLLWEIAKRAFLFFVTTTVSSSNLVYGSVAAIIAFLTWADLTSLIFLFGAFLSVTYWKQKQLPVKWQTKMRKKISELVLRKKS
jgi:membrane protein